MSRSDENEVGIIAFWRYQAQLNFPPPFLRRNIRQSLDKLTLSMGSSPSKFAGKSQNLEHTDAADGDDLNDARPAKRRRFSSSSLQSSQSASSRPHAHKTATVSPSKFYAKPAANPTIIDAFTNQEPLDFRRAVRIDLLSIRDKTEQHEESDRFSERTKCKFTLSLFYGNFDNPTDEITEDFTELVKKVQIGDLKTEPFGSGDGRFSRTIVLPEPFVFTSAELFVNRTKNNLRQPDRNGSNVTYDLADRYRAQLVIERIGDDRYWPPLQVPENLGAMRKLVILQCRFPIDFTPDRQNRSATISFLHRSKRASSLYSLKTQVQWSVPHQFHIQRKESLSLESISPRSPKLRREVATSGADEPLLPLASSLPDDQLGNEGRARRGKVVNTYNLKALSAQAQGKSPRKRKAHSYATESQSKDIAGPHISFSFGPADSSENGIRQNYVFHTLTCPFCECSNPTVEQLRFHLFNEHDKFKFHVRRSTHAQTSFFVEVLQSRPSTPDGRTIQMGKPSTLFDLEKYLNGDNSWINSRHGPQHNHWPDHLVGCSRPSDLSRSPKSCRRNAPNTLLGVDKPSIDTDKPLLEVNARNEHILVPKTRKPLFHTITKQVLKPGTSILESEEDASENWFYQKHREIIDDFEDVDVEDKEYFHKWNPFAMEAQKTRSLPDTIISFVDVHGHWLAESSGRREKFMAHMNVLLLQGAATETLASQCTRRIREIQAETRDAMIISEPEAEPRSRGVYDCLCLQHVPLHDRMVCVGDNCKNRYYHKSCAVKLAIPEAERGDWRCDSCLEGRGLLEYN